MHGISRPQAVPVRVTTLHVSPMMKSFDVLYILAISVFSSSAGHSTVPLDEAAGHLCFSFRKPAFHCIGFFFFAVTVL